MNLITNPFALQISDFGTSTVICLPSNIEDVDQEFSVLAHPNPTSNRINITFNSPFTGEIRLYSSVGEIIEIRNVNEERNK